MEAKTYVKDTPVLIIFGVIFIIVFGWWLIQLYSKFDFTQKWAKFNFIMDNYELMGCFFLGVLLLLIALFG